MVLCEKVLRRTAVQYWTPSISSQSLGSEQSVEKVCDNLFIHFMAPYSTHYTKANQQLPPSVVPKALSCLPPAVSINVQKDCGSARLIGCSRFSGVLHSINFWYCGCGQRHFD